MGRKDLVKILLDHKADGRIHPITRYSPLYIVAFKGKRDIVEIILKVFLLKRGIYINFIFQLFYFNIISEIS